MKTGRPCPKCASADRFVIDEVKSPDYQYSNAIELLTLTAAYTETGEGGFLGPKKERIPVRLEAHVCAGCGYTELHAKDLEVLARFADHQLGGVRRVRGRS